MKILPCTVWDPLNPVLAAVPPLTYSSAPENDHPAFNGPSTYAVGDRVIRTSTHRIYECVQAGVGSDGIPGGVPEFDVTQTRWRPVGWTRPYRMLDGRTDTVTSMFGLGALEVVIPASNASSIAMFGLIGDSVTVSVSDGGGAYVYTKTKSLLSSSVVDWLGYFFDGYQRATEVLFDDLPLFNTQAIRVTITPASGLASCSILTVGRPQHLGDVQLNGTSFGIRDYSRKDLDEFGVATLVRRSFAERASFKVEVPNGRIAWLQAQLSAERAKPVVWIGDDDVNTYAPLFLCGFYRDFQTNLALPTRSYCSIEVEGLI